MVRCSDCTLGCKACAFQYLFAGRSSDIWSFWPIQQNSSFTSVPVRSPIYWTEPETSPFPALHICTEIHAGARFTHTGPCDPGGTPGGGGGRATRMPPHTTAGGSSLKAILGPFWQIPDCTLLQFRQWNETAQGVGPHLMKASNALWVLL